MKKGGRAYPYPFFVMRGGCYGAGARYTSVSHIRITLMHREQIMAQTQRYLMHKGPMMHAPSNRAKSLHYKYSVTLDWVGLRKVCGLVMQPK